jgi:hypothetical protein
MNGFSLFVGTRFIASLIYQGILKVKIGKIDEQMINQGRDLSRPYRGRRAQEKGDETLEGWQRSRFLLACQIIETILSG